MFRSREEVAILSLPSASMTALLYGLGGDNLTGAEPLGPQNQHSG